MQLVIGNKNYSSWSMRPWVLLRHFQISFDEVRIPLFSEGYRERLRQFSPTLKVPVLIDKGHTIWDSLAICEYISEHYQYGEALPEERFERACCRSYCAEMHSGFAAIRSEMPMNCTLIPGGEARAEVRRIDELWSNILGRTESAGRYLFGNFSLADCMYAPMAMRFHTYAISLSEISQTYVESLLENPAIKQWRDAAAQEIEILHEFEVGSALSDS